MGKEAGIPSLIRAFVVCFYSVDSFGNKLFQSSRKKGVFDDDFSYPYILTPHLNCLGETVQMRGQNMFFAQLTKIIPNYYQIPPLI